MASVDVNAWWELSAFSAPQYWYGETVPDFASVQLNVKDVPSVKLATAPGSLRIGMSVATAGFSLGESVLLPYKKVMQLTPLLLRGIISGPFPFPCPQPQGFTLDIMMQGGASGSPIFLEGDPLVVDMVSSGLRNTNINVALPSALIAGALESLLSIPVQVGH